MRLQILGLNHNTAPIEIREQVVFAGDEVGRAVERLTDIEGVEEAVLLSTCNRTEFYVITSDGGRERLQSWLRNERSLDPAFSNSLFALDADEAIRHIFRVACGLDSMVLGEPQILGQLKDAYREAQQFGTVGRQLSRLFQHTFSVAKKVRTDTEIGTNPVSVASAAVSLAQQFFAGFSQHTALLVGAGVTVELLARHLTAKELGRLFVANRDLERARRLASTFGGYAVPLSELEGTLPEADILITSTASPEPIITRSQIEAAMKTRKHKPIFAVDIAVPRDIAADVAELSDVYLYTIDDLQKVIQEGQTHREAAAVDANRILDEEIARYLSIERAKQASPVITALREHGATIRDGVLRDAQRRLDKGVDSREVIEFATASLMKKLLHNPSVRLREAAEASEEELIAATRALFGIDED
ncbi:MAG: glutamyl-tRNA reductase [Gammaproteobacteria bacterium]|jgi:glutamyl-tRNA reductase|nr:glutamyl-tRNA reductase [Gammaproteobacteria bacterium]MDH3749475.1 glutamyl-tRNA reductase [Gammaproteobacteria bacterium]MDH3804383.1 glutamyl-tRNA reductase [Gammaproteobacteria bacterium]